MKPKVKSKVDRKTKVKQFTLKLLRREFGDSLVRVEWWGPYEGEDIDATVFLKEEPADLDMRSYRIHEQLDDAGWDVGIIWDWPEETAENDKGEGLRVKGWLNLPP